MAAADGLSCGWALGAAQKPRIASTPMGQPPEAATIIDARTTPDRKIGLPVGPVQITSH